MLAYRALRSLILVFELNLLARLTQVLLSPSHFSCHIIFVAYHLVSWFFFYLFAELVLVAIFLLSYGNEVVEFSALEESCFVAIAACV